MLKLTLIKSMLNVMKSASHWLIVMSNINIPQIVNILIKDEFLVRNWRQLYDSLNIFDSTVFVWDSQLLTGGITVYQLFTNIITCWKSQRGHEAHLEALCLVLARLGHVNSSEHLLALPEKQEPKANSLDLEQPALNFNIPIGIRDFVGRSKELKSLKKSTINNVNRNHLTLISGLGGIGKSELLKEFVKRLPKGKFYCTWLQGQTRESLTVSIYKLAKHLHLHTTDENCGIKKNIPAVLEQIADKILNTGVLKDWILIVDNVDDPHEEFKMLVNCFYPLDVYIFVTSRNRNILGSETELMEIDEWQNEEAVMFVQSAVKTLQDGHNVTELCELLQNYPLALRQAVAYIMKQQRLSSKGKAYGISDFLKEFRTRSSNVLGYELPEYSHKFKATTLGTWNVTMDKISQSDLGHECFALMHVLAYCNPDGIGISLVSTLVNCEGCAIETTTAAELLKGYSLLKIENEYITLHRLVQEVLRIKLVQSKREITILSSMIDRMDVSKLNRTDILSSIILCKHAINHVDLLQSFPKFIYEVSERLLKLGLYTVCLEFAELYYAKFRDLFGEIHTVTLEMENFVARATHEIGDYERALILYLKIKEKQTLVVEVGSTFALKTLHNIANVYANLERNEEALAQSREVLRLKIKFLGTDHEDTILTKHTLSGLLTMAEEHDEARKLYHDVLAWNMANLGERHSRTLMIKHNIGWSLFHQGNYTGAKQVLQNVLSISLEVLGLEHNDTLSTKYQLALTLYKLGETEKALISLQEVLACREVVLEKQHPITIKTRNQIEELNGGVIRNKVRRLN